MKKYKKKTLLNAIIIDIIIMLIELLSIFLFKTTITTGCIITITVLCIFQYIFIYDFMLVIHKGCNKSNKKQRYR